MPENKKLRPLVDEYIKWRERKGYKPSNGYSIIRRMGDDWDSQRDPETGRLMVRSFRSVDDVWVEDWFLKATETCQPVTRASYRGWIKGFLEWGVKRHGINPDSTEFDPGVTSHHSIREHARFDKGFLRMVWESQSQVYWRALMAFAGMTLARGIEIRNARVGSLLANNTIWVVNRTKTGDMGDRLPVMPALQKELARYLMWYRADIGRELEPSDYLFPAVHAGRSGILHVKGPKLRRHELHRPFQNMIIPHLGPDFPKEQLVGMGGHTLRRSFAAELFETLVQLPSEPGAPRADPLSVVQDMLGHASPLMTLLYIGLKSRRAARNAAIRDLDLFGDTEAEVSYMPLRSVQQN